MGYFHITELGMKVLLLVTLVAAVSGEADPYLLYGGFGYAGYGGLVPTASGGLVPAGAPSAVGAYGTYAYGAYPYAYAAPVAVAGPWKNNDGAAVPCAAGYGHWTGYPYLFAAAPADAAADGAVEEARKKREARRIPTISTATVGMLDTADLFLLLQAVLCLPAVPWFPDTPPTPRGLMDMRTTDTPDAGIMPELLCLVPELIGFQAKIEITNSRH